MASVTSRTPANFSANAAARRSPMKPAPAGARRRPSRHRSTAEMNPSSPASGHAAPAGDQKLPIVLARVDNRLVHGQILSAWVPALDADTLLVIDDEAARN